MRTKAIFLILCLLLLVPFQVYSQEKIRSTYHAKVQFAGHLGFLSVGAGRSFFQEKLETDLFLGYLPEKIGGDRIFTAALKATYVPLKPIPVRSLDWQPLRTGLQLGYTLGSDYFAFEPHDKYPKSYYGFSTALHLYYFLGGQVNFTRVEKLSRFGAYYEVGTNVEYLVSYIQNPKYLGPGKIFNLALGVRMKL
ncbi:hypothetical protein [Pontibacter roseus]|uniref:hypothetical protein n=1 Tax=Pontibacter roseus TaxID=336989 RepID=UPI00036D2DFF|nr:hypothetical protein [Pontibacter roseus]